MQIEISDVFRHLLSHGVRGTVYHGIFRISEMWNERYFSINTSEIVEPRRLGINNPECNWYVPISYPSFKSVMKHIEIERGQDVFIDFGAGKGRAVVLASTFPFKRVIGVELVPELAAMARENLRRASKRLRCQQVEIVTADAPEYSLPDDTTIIHFFNPFEGEILSRVAHNIKASLLKSPRRLTIVWGREPRKFERVLSDGNSIPNKWIMNRQDVVWPRWVDLLGEYNPRLNRYRIYRIYPQGDLLRARF